MLSGTNDRCVGLTISSVCTQKAIGDFKSAKEVKKYVAEDKYEKLRKLLLFSLCGLFIGGINGMFGAGGGMLAVPILSFVGGLNDRRAHATAILVMLPLCLASAVVYCVSKEMDYAVFAPTVIGVFLGGIVGAKLLKFIPEIWLFLAFNLIVLIAGFKMIF